MKRRKTRDGIETGVCVYLREGSGGCPFIGQAVSGVKVARVRSAATARNVGRREAILRFAAWEGGGWREGERQAAGTV